MAAICSLAGVGCGRKAVDAAWWEGEQERIDLVQQLALKEFRLSKRRDSGVLELEMLRLKSTGMAGSLASLTGQRDRLEQEIESLDARLMALRDDLLQERRQQALNRTFERLDANNGHSYQQVSVVAVDDAGVSIRHADGSARLRFGDLNEEHRQLFGLDQESALAAEEVEAADAAAYDRWIAQRLLVIHEEKESRELLDEAAARKVRENKVYAAREPVVASVSPLARPNRDLTYRPSRYRVYRSRYRPTYHYNYQPPCRPVGCASGVTWLNRPAQLAGRCNPYYPQGFRQ